MKSMRMLQVALGYAAVAAAAVVVVVVPGDASRP